MLLSTLVSRPFFTRCSNTFINKKYCSRILFFAVVKSTYIGSGIQNSFSLNLFHLVRKYLTLLALVSFHNVRDAALKKENQNYKNVADCKVWVSRTVFLYVNWIQKKKNNNQKKTKKRRKICQGQILPNRVPKIVPSGASLRSHSKSTYTLRWGEGEGERGSPKAYGVQGDEGSSRRAYIRL